MLLETRGSRTPHPGPASSAEPPPLQRGPRASIQRTRPCSSPALGTGTQPRPPRLGSGERWATNRLPTQFLSDLDAVNVGRGHRGEGAGGCGPGGGSPPSVRAQGQTLQSAGPGPQRQPALWSDSAPEAGEGWQLFPSILSLLLREASRMNRRSFLGIQACLQVALAADQSWQTRPLHFAL